MNCLFWYYTTSIAGGGVYILTVLTTCRKCVNKGSSNSFHVYRLFFFQFMAFLNICQASYNSCLLCFSLNGPVVSWCSIHPWLCCCQVPCSVQLVLLQFWLLHNFYDWDHSEKVQKFSPSHLLLAKTPWKPLLAYTILHQNLVGIA